MIHAHAVDRTFERAAEASQPAAPTILDVRHLTVQYGDVIALDDISFAVQAGERVAIIGPNGAGKSTLIKAIVGLLQAQSGECRLVGSAAQSIGYVPQHEGVDWSFPVTVLDVVMMGRLRHLPRFGWSSRAQRAEGLAALERVGMRELAGRPIHDLSGGQRRRVFIARALAQEARLLLLDEPFSGVDASAQSSLMELLDSLNADGLTILLTTHDLGLAFSRFDRVLALRQSLLAFGAADEVYRPEVLSRLYGGQLATWQDGKRVLVFVDDHHCSDC